jgi:hypothetical protein
VTHSSSLAAEEYAFSNSDIARSSMRIQERALFDADLRGTSIITQHYRAINNDSMKAVLKKYTPKTTK